MAKAIIAAGHTLRAKPKKTYVSSEQLLLLWLKLSPVVPKSVPCSQYPGFNEAKCLSHQLQEILLTQYSSLVHKISHSFIQSFLENDWNQLLNFERVGRRPPVKDSHFKGDLSHSMNNFLTNKSLP